MKFLLHSCCAPCALPVLERIKNESGFEISLYFFNPNIYPDEEYDCRMNAMKILSKIYNVPLLVENPGYKEWKRIMFTSLDAPLESYAENGKRCDVCLTYRLTQAARFAKMNNFKVFATTLSVSLWKNTGLIVKLGHQLADVLGVGFRDFSEINPHEAHKEERPLSEKYGIYLQKYCGCEYSLQSAGRRCIKK